LPKRWQEKGKIQILKWEVVQMAHVMRRIGRPAKEVVTQFWEIAPATAHEALGKAGAMMSNIKPIYNGMKVCGPALTVRCHPGDNIMLHKAVAIAEPGDVLVACVGCREAGYWGEILTVAAQARGIAGLVLDGSVRDGVAIKKRGFPIFCQGLCMKGTVKETIEFINHPISCGDVLVNPGDIILGDDDGVVVIPKDRAEEILKKCQEREKKEEEIMRELVAGKLTLELLGFDKILEAKGLQEE
jgi:4-hydroxy-4-methyl-2-oxoglutarate aldolase